MVTATEGNPMGDIWPCLPTCKVTIYYIALKVFIYSCVECLNWKWNLHMHTVFNCLAYKMVDYEPQQAWLHGTYM